MKTLRRLRKAAGLTQFKLARLARVSYTRLTYAEVGRATLTEEEMERIRKAIISAREKDDALLARTA
jgi:transcriptional regulator with XRE-family HTH domain